MTIPTVTQQDAPRADDTRILIIDDKPAVICQLELIVRHLGTITFATTGADGIALAKAQQPDLILLDVEMAPMDGFEVCASLKAAPATAEIPIIFVTGRRGAENEVACLEAGGNDFICKPLTSEVVQARVRTQLALQRAVTELRRLTLLDPLTNLYNRRFLDQQLAIECNRQNREKGALGVLIVDLDYFKQYNDTFGHQAGDVALIAVAAVLRGAARRPGDFVSRFGGEEFVIVAPKSSADGLATYANQLQSAVASLDIAHPLSPYKKVTVSIGVALAAAGVKCQPGPLVRSADEALYEAKAAGRNQTRFHIADVQADV